MGRRASPALLIVGLALAAGGAVLLLVPGGFGGGPGGAPAPPDAPGVKDSTPVLAGLSEEALRAHRAHSAARWRELLAAEDPEARRQNAADWARSGLEPAAAAAVLVPLLTDADPEMRRTVRHALRTIGEPAVTVLLGASRSTDDWELPALTIEVLGLIALADGRSGATPALLAILADGTQQRAWRTRAAIALGHVRPVDPGVTAALKKAMRDRDKEVAAAAIEGLGALGAEVEDQIPTLLAMLEDPDQADLQSEAALALGRIGRRADIVLPALHQWGGPQVATAMARFGKAALPWLEAKLADEDAQHFALAVLEEMGPDGAPLAPRLIRLADQGDEFGLVWRVQKVVGEMGPAARAVVPDIVRIVMRLENEYHVVHVWLDLLHSLGPDGEAALRGLVDTGGPAVRMNAAWELATHFPRSPETRPRIQRLADEDREEGVRNQALWALRKIDGR